MTTFVLLITVTILYAGYNLLVKVASSDLPEQATTTVLATIALQLAALTASSAFALFLVAKGGQGFQLSLRTYLWAGAAGLCIGGAEIAYFYLFSGLGHGKPMPASTVVPFVVSGTIIITMIVSHFIFKESFAWTQLGGSLLIIFGIYLLFANPGGSSA